MKLFDVVKLIQDLPDEGLKKDQQGTIVEILKEPSLAYEVEFCDKNGRTICLTTLMPEQIEIY